nr:hypothetical protein [uncultured Mediterranean phage uvMED]
MAILLGFLTLLTTLIRIILKLANQFYRNESILVMKNKYLSYKRDVRDDKKYLLFSYHTFNCVAFGYLSPDAAPNREKTRCKNN